MADKETLNVEAALEKLKKALALQYRSALQYTLFSASLFGFEYQALGDRMWQNAQAELADARLLVEKIVALGGEPAVDVANLSWTGKPGNAVETLIEQEMDAIEALQDVIPETGHEGRSEALEHLMEHVILRKHNQLDFLERARRTS